MLTLTEPIYLSRLLKVRFLAIALFSLITFPLSAQNLMKVKTIQLEASPSTVSQDRQGYFYIGLTNGDIDKYDREGNLLYHFSAPKNGQVSLIEAWQGLRIFCYYQDFQDYLYLNRFLTESERFSVPNNQASFLSLVTLAWDNNLWIVDAQELNLKKIELPSNELITETPFNLNLENSSYQFEHIRDYQNRLYISDKQNGILIFDRFGNYLETLPISGVEHFSFVADELVYLKDDSVFFIDVYTKKEREIGLPDPSYKFVLMENSVLICFADTKVDLYQIN